MTYWDGTRWMREDAGEVPRPPGSSGRARRIWAAGLEALIITTLIFGVVAGSVLAAKGGRGSVSVPDGYLGGTVTATVNPGGDGVWAYAACFQGGERVYGQYEKVDDTNQVVFNLGPTPSWASGDADCVAQEGTWTKGGKWRVVAEATFQATDPN